MAHREQIEYALEPDEMGRIWSGSGAVDWQNSAGFQAGADPALALC
ncbi:MAG: hypothetical protein IT210_10595 [Armatimonadetes bacterium]|nr:hypothetical protein [Armatimonadota bacterium]